MRIRVAIAARKQPYNLLITFYGRPLELIYRLGVVLYKSADCGVESAQFDPEEL